jgi:glycosyltransferase involved in cell wall biosynthesis
VIVTGESSSAVASPPVALSIVVPVFNERGTILEVLRRVDAACTSKEILVVDDGSTDGTRALLSAVETLPAAVRVLLQDRNRGKGAALRRGFAEARGDIVIVQDADLELNPADYARLLPPIVSGEASVVYGSRFMAGRPADAEGLYYLANRILTALSNLLTGLSLSDVWTGYKVFRRDVIQSVELQEDRFGFEPEVTAAIARGGWRIAEVPVSYQPRRRAEGKKIRVRDAFNGAWCTVKHAPLLQCLFTRPTGGA